MGEFGAHRHVGLVRPHPARLARAAARSAEREWGRATLRSADGRLLAREHLVTACRMVASMHQNDSFVLSRPVACVTTMPRGAAISNTSR